MLKLLKTLFLPVLVMFLLNSCGDKPIDCSDYACFTPPQPFSFEFIDKESKENLFSNGTYTPVSFSIRTDKVEGVEFTYEERNERFILTTHSIGWDSEVVTLEFQNNEETICTVEIDAERVSEDCCNFTRINGFQLEGQEYKQEEETAIYVVSVNNGL